MRSRGLNYILKRLLDINNLDCTNVMNRCGDHYKSAVRYGYINTFKIRDHAACKPPGIALKIAAKYGNIQSLQYIMDCHKAKPLHVLLTVAAYGHAHVLRHFKYLFKCIDPLSVGSYLLDPIITRMIEGDFSRGIAFIAKYSNKQRDSLQWIILVGDDVELMQWFDICSASMLYPAIVSDGDKCFNWLLERVTIEPSHLDICVHYDKLDKLKILSKYCPLYSGLLHIAVQYKSCNVLEWILSQGIEFPLDDGMLRLLSRLPEMITFVERITGIDIGGEIDGAIAETIGDDMAGVHLMPLIPK
jgi:hypothetical protein